MTYYIYDANLKLLLGTQKLVSQSGASQSFIWTTNILDAAGRTLVSDRAGTDGSVITLGQAQFDVLGRVTSQTNALGGVTLFTNFTDFSAGLTYQTNTFADGGTRVEAHNRDGTLAMVTGTAVQPVRYAYGVTTDGGFYRSYVQEIKLQLNGSDSSESTTTYTDGAGHPYKTTYNSATTPYPATLSLYNSAGQLWKEQDPDGVTTIHVFNTKGELEFNIAALSSTILNMAYPDLSNGLLNATLILSTLPDRVTRIQRSVQAAAGAEPDVVRVDTLVWDSGMGTGTLVSRSDTYTGGPHSWQTIYGDAGLAVVTQVTNVVDGLGDRYSTNIAPDGSYVVSLYYLGRLTNVVRMNSLGSQVSSTAYSYDTHGRQAGLTDARNGTTSYTYNNADLVSSVTTPNPGTLGGAAETTSTYYNQMLQATNVVNPDGTSVEPRKRGQASTLVISLDKCRHPSPPSHHAASGAHPVSRCHLPRHEPGQPPPGHLPQQNPGQI